MVIKGEIDMNIFACILKIIAQRMIHTRFSSFVLNDAYAKLMVISGAIKWYDVPHLHNLIIDFIVIPITEQKREKLK